MTSLEHVLFFGLAACVLSFAVFMERMLSDKWGPESNARQDMTEPTQCERHKLYTGWSKPIDPCLACWRRYQERHPDAGVDIRREDGNWTVTYKHGAVVNKVVVPE